MIFRSDGGRGGWRNMLIFTALLAGGVLVLYILGRILPAWVFSVD